MKHLFFVLVIAMFAMACNNQAAAPATNSDSMSAKKEAAFTAPADLPYKMMYTKWDAGDPKNLKAMLDFYKHWDDGKPEMDAALFGDTSVFEMPSGRRITAFSKNIADSLKKWREESGTNLSTDVITAISLHSPEKNEDWVVIWSMSHWTDKKGKTDSMFNNDNWQLRNGKIVYLSSLEQKPIR